MTHDATQPDTRPASKPVYPEAAPKTGPAASLHAQVRGKKLHWLKWGDYVLFALIGGTAMLLFLLMPVLTGQREGEKNAIVIVDQKEIFRLTEKELQETGEMEITANGYHYHLAWQDGRIRVAQADCPDKVCVRTGWISRVNDIVACVPGRLILKIVGTADQDQNDQPDVIVR
jgi:hypothetical protein